LTATSITGLPTTTTSLERGKNHVNGIESFRGYKKKRHAKFNGLQETHFLLHLKKSQWRWNMRVSGKSIYHTLLETFRNEMP